MKKILTLIATILFVSTTSIHAQGNLVVNGGFNNDASGWLTTNVASWAGYEPAKGNPGGTFLLAAPTDSSEPAGLYQLITGLTVGNIYTISGDYDVEASSLQKILSFGVTVDQNLHFTTAPVDYQWDHFSFTYRATQSTALLSVMAYNGYDYRVDNFTVQAVPEPSAGLFLLVVLFVIMLGLALPRHA